MITEERDELIERAARSLAVLPPANHAVVMGIVQAARAHRRARPSLVTQFTGWMRAPSLSVASATMLAAATLVIGFVSGGSFNGAATAAADRGGVIRGGTTLIPAADAGADSRSVAVPMLLDAPSAKSVAVVGDFNDWDPTATPMQRFGGDGPWTVTMMAKPGRHLYAFMVDGVLTADPRAPKTKDVDYGGEASVLMVTKP